MAAGTRYPPNLIQKVQEIPYDHPESCRFFTKPLVATPAALATFGAEAIFACYLALREQAARCNGIDYLQVFDDHANPGGPALRFIEGGEAVTALLPSDC